jgi:hypothetical protein
LPGIDSRHWRVIQRRAGRTAWRNSATKNCAGFAGAFAFLQLLALAWLTRFQEFLVMETQVVLVAQWREPILHDIQTGFRALKPLD